MACFPIFERKAKRHRTLVAIGFLKCDLLAYKPGQFIRGGLHEVLAWRPCSLFSLNHRPAPKNVTLRQQENGC